MHVRLLALAASVAALGAWSTPKHPAPVKAAVTYTAHMNGASETPGNTVKGTGTATFVLDGTHLRYTVTAAGLSGPATMAHIHLGKAGVSGPPVFSFEVKHEAAGTLAHGEIDLAKEVSKGVSGDSLKVLLNNGNAYVNVHTAAHPGGEIRGQIEKSK
ncbi:MAG TPA: CHRD domain-containing protein [Gemmatimonadaceae bacterium]|nr:CHRD domain-containing protein [Gemmatimonadaceae bacterium]